MNHHSSLPNFTKTIDPRSINLLCLTLKEVQQLNVMINTSTRVMKQIYIVSMAPAQLRSAIDQRVQDQHGVRRARLGRFKRTISNETKTHVILHHRRNFIALVIYR